MFPPETLWPLAVAAGDPEEPAEPVQPAARTAAATQLAAIPRVERVRVERLGVERVNKRTVAPFSPAALKGQPIHDQAVARVWRSGKESGNSVRHKIRACGCAAHNLAWPACRRRGSEWKTCFARLPCSCA